MQDSNWPPPTADSDLLLQPWQGLSDDLLLRKARATFHLLAVGEIRRILHAPNPTGFAPAILCCCAIDFLGTLLAGKKASGANFRGFVASFLPPQYTALYDLRNRLVHNYVPSPHFAIMIGRQHAALHLSLTGHPGSSTRWLVVDLFLDDIEAGGEQLFASARSPGAVRERMLKYLASAAPVTMGKL